MKKDLHNNPFLETIPRHDGETRVYNVESSLDRYSIMVTRYSSNDYAVDVLKNEGNASKTVFSFKKIKHSAGLLELLGVLIEPAISHKVSAD